MINDATTRVIEAESLEHEAHVPSFNEAQQLKATDLLDSIQRRMKDMDNFMIKGEEMMFCCLTKETYQTAPRLALDEERNETGELEAGEQSLPRTTTFITTSSRQTMSHTVWTRKLRVSYLASRESVSLVTAPGSVSRVTSPAIHHDPGST